MTADPRPDSLDGAQLSERIAAIGSELRAWQPLWAEHAFRSPRLAWERDHAGLADALRALPLEQAGQLHARPDLADRWLCEWLPVARWNALARVPAASTRALAPWPHDFARDVPGRKWAQIEAFVAALECAPDARFVDWCAGKAHLSRALAQQYPEAGVLALERDAALVMDGVRLARRSGVGVHAVRCDVMSGAVTERVQPQAHVVALHACGHLHLRLFDLAASRQPRALSCAPCCYHLGGEAGAQPRSMAGRTAWPGLSLADLRTAVQETVTADAHVRRRRQKLQQWQLGFDLLVREMCAHDGYLPIPAVDAGVLRGSFAGFCAVIAGRKSIALPRDCDFARYEAAGRRRFVEVSALDLVRHRFRRLLELWLVLDRALALAEHGYRVALGTFCERSLSPRNLLLQARLE